MRVRIALQLLWVLAGACAHGPESGPSSVRFRNAEPVWAVNDTGDVPEAPKSRDFLRNLFFFEEVLVEPTERSLSLQRSGRAQNINALGEVPDSTWFTNRWPKRHSRRVPGSSGEREPSGPSPLEIARGPYQDGPPDTSRPLEILSTKLGGTTPGLTVEDARGLRYILEFDASAHPEKKTAAGVIVQRLLWAIGFNVPEDNVIDLERRDLVLAEGAVRKRPVGEDLPFRPEDLQRILDDVHRYEDGRFRALASRILPGKPLGGFTVRGVREDDPNDRVRHEDRRELRGQHVFFAWVHHTDVKPDNTLDMWVEAPGNANHHFVKHYLLDFDKALGNLAVIDRYPEDGFAYLFDFAYAGPSFVSLGLLHRPWDALRWPRLTGVGRFEAGAFDPAKWKPYYPYLPIVVRDPLDDYWAAKIVVRFTRAQIEAAVGAGRLTSPAARDHLTDVLLARQQTLARWAFSRVAPFEDFQVEASAEGPRLCFIDLWSHYGFDRDAPAGNASEPSHRSEATSIQLTTYDDRGRKLDDIAVSQEAGSRWCSADLGWRDRSRSDDAYTIAVLRTHRADRSLPSIEVHLAAGPTRDATTRNPLLRVIGIHRHAD